VTRRDLLALLSLSAALSACGGRVAPAAPAASPEPLALGSAVDLVPAAGLVWLVDARLRELFASNALIPALALVLPASRLDAFARRHGGIDLRSASELAIAGYPEATLAVARAVLDPARVEGAFAARAVSVEGRAVEGSVVRTWGAVGSGRQQIAILGREAIALEQGRFGPLRAAEYFARGRLKRARPALLAEPLAHAAPLLGDAPLRAFAPGPFEGTMARGLGGLLAAATAVGGAATPVDRDPGGALALRFVVTGAWGADAAAAADRLRAAFDVLASDPLGRLMGVDRPLDGPRASGDAEALRLDVTVDALSLGKGLRDATGATVEEVMRL
jgi:hypothetical protein